MGYPGTLPQAAQRAEVLDVLAAVVAVALLAMVQVGASGPPRTSARSSGQKSTTGHTPSTARAGRGFPSTAVTRDTRLVDGSR